MKIEGTLRFEGDKSLSHRAAIFAALAQGRSVIRNFLSAEDTRNTLKAMESLGVRVERTKDEIIVTSGGMATWQSPNHPLDMGNAGTGSRLLLGLLAGLPGITAVVDGDASLRKRPMKRVTAPLAAIGAHFEPEDKLPIKVTGASLGAIHFREELGSAQVKSAIMLAAVTSGSPLVIEEPVPSRDHTENMLRFAGVDVQKTPLGTGFVITMKPPYKLQPREYNIWGDISSAAFFVVAALLADEGELLVRDVLLNPYRDKYLDILKQMGGDITILPQADRCGEKGGDLLVRPSRLKGITIAETDIPAIIDELPILTIAGAFAEGEFCFRGARELRVKESDRIAAMVNNLRACGAEVEEFEDGLALKGDPGRVLQGAVESHMDHRIVMSFEIARLRSQANAASDAGLIAISGREWVATSFPDFFDKLRQVSQADALMGNSPSTVSVQDTPAVVTFDGPAGSGKSSLAKLLADSFPFYQADSGAIYRAYTWLALQYKSTVAEALADPEFGNYLQSHPLAITFGSNRRQLITCDGRLLADELRTPEITREIRHVADNRAIRERVNHELRVLARQYPLVVDGRDMGTVVFPDAPIKFFITASVEERAKRRLLEFQEKYPKMTLAQVEQEIRRRDEQDQNREFGGLRAANDAILVDTTNHTQKATLQIVVSYLRHCNSRQIRALMSV